MTLFDLHLLAHLIELAGLLLIFGFMVINFDEIKKFLSLLDNL